jgi:hypothetical protein
MIYPLYRECQHHVPLKMPATATLQPQLIEVVLHALPVVGLSFDRWSVFSELPGYLVLWHAPKINKFIQTRPVSASTRRPPL